MPSRNNSNLRISSAPRVSVTAVMVVFLVCSIIITAVYMHEDTDGPLHTVQAGVQTVISPFRFVGAGLGASGDAAGEAVDNLTVDTETYSALQDENEQLKAEIIELEEYRQEAQRLEGLVGLADTYSMDIVTGRVSGEATDAWDDVVTVDVGSNDGVEPGMAAIGSAGLVGEVVSVTPVNCQVRLITDSNSGISAIIQSTRATCTVSGSLEGLLYLRNLDSSESVSVGDVIVTSGLGGTVNRGIPIGVVSAVEQSAGSTDRTIIVTPLTEVDSLEEVSIVLSMDGDGALSDTIDTTIDTSSTDTSSSSTDTSSQDTSSLDSSSSSSSSSSTDQGGE